MRADAAPEAGRDEGLALPRTALAWRRTSIAVLAVAVSSIRVSMTCLGTPVLIGIATVAAASTLTLLVVVGSGRRPPHELSDTDHDTAAQVRDGRALLAVSLAIVLVAVVELAAATSRCN